MALAQEQYIVYSTNEFKDNGADFGDVQGYCVNLIVGGHAANTL